MKKKTKLVLLIIVGILIIIQLIPVDRTNPKKVVANEVQAPQEVMDVLKVACYDCHSNETVWPAYSYIAPISWVIAHHVEEGRGEVNFSEWKLISPKKLVKVKAEIIEEVMEDKMPMPMYLLAHSAARLTDQQKNSLQKWFEYIEK